MNTQRKTQRSSSKREQEHAELLERALARPGIREVMDVYDNWREKEQGLYAYRAATKKPEHITTTNSTNYPKSTRT